jgi:hypothetical protein
MKPAAATTQQNRNIFSVAYKNIVIINHLSKDQSFRKLFGSGSRQILLS